MACFAARYGHLVLVKWLCGEGGFAVDKRVVRGAAGSGNLEVVQWLLREGGFSKDDAFYKVALWTESGEW